jgi:hypothetical protein
MRYIVHPNIGNERRDEVYAWCTNQWGEHNDHNGNDWKWFPTSNYDRGLDSGTFDIHFQDDRLVNLFLIAWGGYVAETEGRPEFKVKTKKLKELFEGI